MQIVDLVIVIHTRPVVATGKYRAQTIHRLAFPTAHLIRMHLVTPRDLLDRPVATKRLKRNLGLEIRRETVVGSSSSYSSIKGRNTP